VSIFDWFTMSVSSWPESYSCSIPFLTLFGVYLSAQLSPSVNSDIRLSHNERSQKFTCLQD